MSHLEVEINGLERDSRQLTDLFQYIVNDMKGSTVIWEDFSNKAAKLHLALRSTILVITHFLDAFQKVADLANGSKGATRDIGVALTRLCVRHRSIETKLRAFAAAITDTVVEPLQMRLEEWKKTAVQMDRDHAKEYKKLQNEIKKASSDTIRLQKRAKKGDGDYKLRLDNTMQDVHKKYALLEEVERHAVRSAMIEERSHFCSFLSFLKPLMEQEIAMFTEFTHLQEIVELLLEQTADPMSLPQACEQVILDLKDSTMIKSSSSGSAMTLGSYVGSYRSSTCSIDSSSSGYSQSQASSYLGGNQVSDSQATIAVPQESVESNGKDDSSSSDFSSLSVAGSHSTTSLHSANAFCPSSNAPASSESSEFLHRSHTISYGHSGTRPFFTTFESKGDGKQETAANTIPPSNSNPNGNPSENSFVRQLPEMAEDGKTLANIYAKPSIHGMRRQGVAAFPVTPPSVPVKQHSLQSYQTLPTDGGDGDRKEPSHWRPVCRSFSFPTQAESSETLDSNISVRTEPEAHLPDPNVKQVFNVTTADVTETCNNETKSFTLPRMPQFKVPLIPQRYSSNLSGKGGPPTLPKRTSSKLCSVKPSFPPTSTWSGSLEHVPATTMFKPSSSNLLNSADTTGSLVTETEIVTKVCDDRQNVTNDNKDTRDRNSEQRSGHVAEPDEDQSSASSPGFSLRQQAPPTDDDSDRLCPLPPYPAAVLPLMEEVLEFSVCQMQLSVHDNEITKPGEEDLPGGNTTK